jgi:hypothetical protein
VRLSQDSVDERALSKLCVQNGQLVMPSHYNFRIKDPMDPAYDATRRRASALAGGRTWQQPLGYTSRNGSNTSADDCEVIRNPDTNNSGRRRNTGGSRTHAGSILVQV